MEFLIASTIARKETIMKYAEPERTDSTDEELSAENLIEEVSIDGMCGVY